MELTSLDILVIYGLLIDCYSSREELVEMADMGLAAVRDILLTLQGGHLFSNFVDDQQCITVNIKLWTMVISLAKHPGPTACDFVSEGHFRLLDGPDETNDGRSFLEKMSAMLDTDVKVRCLRHQLTLSIGVLNDLLAKLPHHPKGHLEPDMTGLCAQFVSSLHKFTLVVRHLLEILRIVFAETLCR